MQTFQNCKFVQTVNPIDTTGATATSAAIDCIGAGEVLLIVNLGNVAANMTALKIQECETSGGSYTDVTGGAWTSPTAASGDNTIRIATINRRNGGRQRYLKIVATGGAGATLISATAVLGELEKTPTSATEQNVTEVLTIN